MFREVKYQIHFLKSSIKTRNLTQILLWLHNLIGFYSFYRLGKRMQTSSNGLVILQKRPQVTKKIIDSYQLHSLKHDSFGYLYIRFMEDNGLDKEPARPPVSPLESEVTAYAK